MAERSPKPDESKPENSDRSQAFIDKARELGADEGKSGADTLFGPLAKATPETREERQKKRRSTSADDMLASLCIKGQSRHLTKIGGSTGGCDYDHSCRG